MGGRLRRGQTESDVRRFAAPGVATPIATQPQGGVLQKPTASPWELIDTTSQSPERANQFPRSPIVTPKELTRPFRARSRMDLCSRGGAPGYLRTPHLRLTSHRLHPIPTSQAQDPDTHPQSRGPRQEAPHGSTVRTCPRSAVRQPVPKAPLRVLRPPGPGGKLLSGLPPASRLPRRRTCRPSPPRPRHA